MKIEVHYIHLWDRSFCRNSSLRFYEIARSARMFLVSAMYATYFASPSYNIITPVQYLDPLCCLPRRSSSSFVTSRRFSCACVRASVIFFFFHTHVLSSFGTKAVVTGGVVPSPPRFLPSIFIAHRVQQSHCSSIFHRVWLTRALALSASQFVHKKNSPRIYTRVCTRGDSYSRNWPIPG